MKKGFAIFGVTAFGAIVISLLVGDYLHNRNYLSGLKSTEEKEDLVYRVGNICLLKENEWNNLPAGVLDKEEKISLESMAYKIKIIEAKLQAAITLSPIESVKLIPMDLNIITPIDKKEEELFDTNLLFDRDRMKIKMKLLTWIIVKESPKRITTDTIFMLASKDEFITKCRNSTTLEIMSTLFPDIVLQYDLSGFNDVYERYRNLVKK